MEFPRKLSDDLRSELKKPEIVYIFGARQVGKTFLLKKLLSEIKNRHTVKYFNLEVPEDLKVFNKNDEEIYNLLTHSGKYIFIDEFHYMKNASHLFKAVYDSDLNIKIFASGSSALEMHRHLKESLAGRTNIYHLKPLDIFEFISGDNLSKKDLSTIFTYGLLPGAYVDKDLKKKGTEDRKKYLSQVLETYIQKDIKSLVQEETIRAFNNLLFILAEKQGQILPSNNLSNDLMISRKTVDRYIDILEKTYVLYPLNSFSQNISNELKKSCKYYLYDFGIRNALLKDFSDYTQRPDKGTLHETLIYYYLLFRKGVDAEIYFWRTSSGNEVDFIWYQNRSIVAIEVKSRLSKNIAFEKQIPSGLKNFLKSYPKTKFSVVFNETLTSEITYKDHKIYFIAFNNIKTFDALIENS